MAEALTVFLFIPDPLADKTEEGRDIDANGARLHLDAQLA